MKNIKLELKRLIIEALELEDIATEDIQDNEPLFEEGLGLDSIDALELGVQIQKKYKITISSDSEENRKHFSSVNDLAQFINNEIENGT